MTTDDPACGKAVVHRSTVVTNQTANPGHSRHSTRVEALIDHPRIVKVIANQTTHHILASNTATQQANFLDDLAKSTSSSLAKQADTICAGAVNGQARDGITLPVKAAREWRRTICAHRLKPSTQVPACGYTQTLTSSPAPPFITFLPGATINFSATSRNVLDANFYVLTVTSSLDNYNPTPPVPSPPSCQ